MVNEPDVQYVCACSVALSWLRSPKWLEFARSHNPVNYPELLDRKAQAPASAAQQGSPILSPPIILWGFLRGGPEG
jgi:hypothetical protein